ncbi:hypothetical protein F5Y06DRAFT_294782 [Hypoxylon sp. FL0890]|nr:hypothetical protein F5Y06DRAFT_294782 [Hypoxylon sp. FL0890]
MAVMDVEFDRSFSRSVPHNFSGSMRWATFLKLKGVKPRPLLTRTAVKMNLQIETSELNNHSRVAEKHPLCFEIICVDIDTTQCTVINNRLGRSTSQNSSGGELTSPKDAWKYNFLHLPLRVLELIAIFIIADSLKGWAAAAALQSLSTGLSHQRRYDVLWHRLLLNEQSKIIGMEELLA